MGQDTSRERRTAGAGFARKGATIFTIDPWFSAAAGEAAAIAGDVPGRIAKFDAAEGTQ